MPEEIESYLFIGGVVDGQWFNVPKSARRWTLPIIATSINDFRKIDELPESVPYTEHTYTKCKLADLPNRTTLYIFVSEDIDRNEQPNFYTDRYWKIMCKLVNNYKVVK